MEAPMLFQAKVLSVTKLKWNFDYSFVIIQGQLRYLLIVQRYNISQDHHIHMKCR